ncbi:MAG: HAD-IA family hydrolase [Paludibacteraceae bacterium]|nr:HAD-IA family hydrolase [Paludibacteraceae bacterium]
MRAWFFDMDGTLFDSMPHHALSWERTMAANGLVFSIEDCYRNEGRTGSDVISTAIRQQLHREATEEEKSRIYAEKAAMFRQMGGAEPIKGVKEVLQYLKDKGDEIWIVTGSGQQSLFDTLESHFPGIFARERMITAYDVTRGKPDPEPYLAAWRKSGFKKKDCRVVENAPLGIRAGKAAGLFTIGINTGPLPDADLQNEGADIVLPDMRTLLDRLQKNDN